MRKKGLCREDAWDRSRWRRECCRKATGEVNPSTLGKTTLIKINGCCCCCWWWCSSYAQHHNNRKQRKHKSVQGVCIFYAWPPTLKPRLYPCFSHSTSLHSKKQTIVFLWGLCVKYTYYQHIKLSKQHSTPVFAHCLLSFVQKTGHNFFVRASRNNY